MARRYLSHSEIVGALRRNKIVESFLGAVEGLESKGISWLCLEPEGSEYYVRLYKAPDLGPEEGFDISSFGSLDLEQDQGEPAVEHMFDSPESAIQGAVSLFPETEGRFVNDGVVQDEYRDFIIGGRNDV